MTHERKAKVKQLREQLKNLTQEQRNQFIKRGMISTIDGHVLSPGNTILCYFQSQDAPTVVGGYQQWKRAQRQVKRGEHGMIIWFPVGDKDEEENIITVDRYYIATVFDITQTETVS